MADVSQVLRALINKESIPSDTMSRMLQMMCLGGVSPSVIGAFFTAYEFKGYTEAELAGILTFLNYKFNQADSIKDDVVHIYADTAFSEYALFLNIILAAHSIPSVTSVDKSIGVNFYNYLGVNTSEDIKKIQSSMENQSIGVYATNYRYKLRNIYDVMNELQFPNIIDSGIPFTCPFHSSKRVVIRQESKRADDLISAVRSDSSNKVYLVSRSEKADFILPPAIDDMSMRSSQLRHMLSGHIDSDNQWILALASELTGNPHMMMKDSIANMRLASRFNNLIEFTNKF
jgi:anthranilate phosphoribosyltransferase